MLDLYTHRDRTAKNRTIADAISIASASLRGRELCLKVVGKRSRSERITMVDQHELIAQIIKNTEEKAIQ
jgi:hypothetical protein